ncbi:hypothetical protein P3T43_000634 [Paraburkholderia sp. GAS41]|jgi:hypothetical protein|uniref:hypothetical protein n=1 Tax=Paraburkholderia sp. GAS41 TaxID=3035134 RepID=UPI003D21A9DB
MNFLDPAFTQLAFAAKLLEYVEQGKLNLDELDQPLTIEGPGIWVLPDRIFNSVGELHRACENQLSVAFGAAAITLNRCREEYEERTGVPLLARNGAPPESEDEHFAELAYQIRNAFAHDISEPRWEIRNPARRRQYLVDRITDHAGNVIRASITVDLTNLNGQRFDYAHIGGIETLHHLREFGRRYWG